MYDLTERNPITENEKVVLKREGQLGKWHGYSEHNGDLIIVDKYRHDAQEFLEHRGFTWSMDYSNGK